MAKDKEGAQDQGVTPEPEQGEETITLTKSALLDLFKEVAATSARAAVEAQEAVKAERDDEASFMASLQTMKPEERESALMGYLRSLTPTQLAAREKRIREAYKALPPAPTVDTISGLVPGDMVESGKDQRGDPVYSKVRPTKAWIEENYPMVDVYVQTPPKGGVTFRTIRFDLVPGLNRVPSPVAELYAWWADTQRRIEATYPPITMAEEEAMRIAIARGAREVWTRVHQVGVGILPPEVIPDQRPPAE